MTLKFIFVKKCFVINKAVSIFCFVISLFINFYSNSQYVQHPIIDSVKVLPNSPLEYEAYKFIVYSKNIRSNCYLDSFLTISSAGNDNIRLRLNYSTDTTTLFCLRIDTIPTFGQHAGVKNLTVLTKVYSSIDTLVDTTLATYTVYDDLGLVKEGGYSNLDLYPNPTNDEINFSLNLSSRNLNVEIYDITGKRIKNIEYNDINDNQYQNTIDVSKFSNGLYFCKFSNGEKQVTRKFIKH